MAIDDPQAIKFCNEVVRPLCERIRALKADIDAARAAYDGGIGDFFFTHGNEAVEDGREAEGVSRLDGNDVLAFVQFALYDQKVAMEAGSIPAVIATPCVRSLITG
jgi:hypothetical protein